jgi:hypothetical protein
MKKEDVIDYAVLVQADVAGWRAEGTLEVEVGAGYTLASAKILANTYHSARIVEAWQHMGLYHYGEEVYRHGTIFSPTPFPVETFQGGFRRG